MDVTGFSLFDLQSAPRPDYDPQTLREDNAGQSFAALVATHRQLSELNEHPMVLGLRVREAGGGAIRFVTGGRPALPGVRPDIADPSHVVVPYPPGTAARPLDPSHLRITLSAFPHWVRCSGQLDPLWRIDDHDRATSMRGSFTNYLSHLLDPFAWLVLAEPVTTAEVDRQASRLEIDIPGMRLRANSESDRLALLRTEARYRDLAEARARGAWMIHILVGGKTTEQTQGAAAMLSAAADVHHLPYVLIPDAHPVPLDKAWNGAESPRETQNAASPFLASTEFLAALTAAPDTELPGIRLLARNPFDVTPEDAPKDSVALGTILDLGLQAAGTMKIARTTLNRHAFVAGATGSGKSQTTRHMLEQLSTSADPVPWLVIEPAKAEYARMAGRLAGTAEVLRIRPGDLSAAPAMINPLEPAPGFPLQSHLDLIRALFLAAFQAEEPFPQILSQALTNAYREAGWDLVTGKPRPATNPTYRRSDTPTPAAPRYPRLDDLQTAARRVVDEVGYAKDVTANVRGFIDVRIGSLLLGTPGRFFRGGHSLDIERLLARNTVFELEDVTDDQDKAFVMGAVIIRLVEHLRVKHGADGCDTLQHVTVIEEAHRLLKNVDEGPGAASVELFASLLAEIRAYGEGIVVVEQIPSKLIPDVIKNSALKVMHRLPAADDRAAVGATINLTERQSRYVVSLRPGLAAAAVDGMDQPLLVSVEPGVRRESASLATRDAPFTGRRSTLCGQTCRSIETAACTLTQINEAAHRADNPLLRVWVEAVCGAYLMGKKLPTPSDATSTRLSALDERELDCLLSHAVDMSLASRWNHLRRYMNPDEFESEFHGQLRHQATTRTTKSVEYRRWQAGPYRWIDMQIFLRRYGTERRYASPTTIEDWRERGAPVSRTESAHVLEALQRAAAREPRASLFGDPDATGLVKALRSLTGPIDYDSIEAAVGLACANAVPSLIANILEATTGEPS